MLIDHDRLFKELLSTFFVEFLELFLPEFCNYLDPASLVFLDKEIFTDVTAGDAMEADLVVKAKLRNSDSFFLVHVEAQSEIRSAFALRMFRYFARLHERYNVPVYPIALFSFDRPKSRQSSTYNMRLPSLNVLTFRYKVIQLNRFDWRSFVKQENPIAAALMAKMQIATHDRAIVKLECLRMIAMLKLNPARQRLISGFVDSYLRLNDTEQREFNARLEKVESPKREVLMEIVTSWMEDGIKIGFERGREEGREQGLERGREQGASIVVCKLLSKRFGPLHESYTERIRSLPLEKIEQMSDLLLEFDSLDDVARWLSEQCSGV